MVSGRSFTSCVCVAMLSLAACHDSKWKSPIRVTAAPWVGNTALISAQEKNRFAPLNVKVVEIENDFDGWRAMLEHKAEMSAGTVLDLVRAVDQGADLRIIMGLDFSLGADGILARPEISSIAELKGKKIAAQKCTTTHFVLLRALERANMAEEDVEIENLSAEEAFQALEEGRVDAAALYEPLLSQGKNAGRRVIFTSAEIPGEVIDVLGVRADVLERRRQDIDKIVQQIHAEVEFFADHRQSAIETIVKFNDMPAEDASESLTTVPFISLSENMNLFDRSRTNQSIWQTYERATAFMKKHKMLLHPPLPPEKVIDRGPLERAATSKP